MNLATCPALEQLRDFSTGRLADEATETIADHLDQCPTCRDSVAELGHVRDPLLAALREPETTPPYSEETDYRRAMKLVEAIGRSPETAAETSPFSPLERGDRREGTAHESPPLATIREYQLQRKLGEGGMGAVYQALHTRLDKLVAIKVLATDRMRDAGAVARFQREMKAVGRLDHPNIVRAMDAGEENGLHFLVMEYVPGIDLAHLSRARGPLPIADACELVRQAALGLAEAHEHGMVHRDIKPSNLILAQPRKRKDQPTVKILDLGLALLSEALSPDQQGLTSTGQMMGTIDYMAPEQGGDSHQVDIRADLYSLGATLYKLLTGEAPFSGEKFDTPVKKLMSLATQAPPPVRSRRAEVPGALASLVENLLAKDPEERLATPEDVAEAIEPFCRGADLGKLLRETSPPPVVEAIPERQSNLGTRPSYSSPSGDTAPTIELQPAAAAKVHRRTPAAQGSRKIPRWALVAGGLGGAALAALLGALYFIQTPNGIVQIEINDPLIQVTADSDGNTVFQGVDEMHKITMKPGPHGLTITRGDFRFETTKFEVRKRGTLRLSVQYLPGKVQVTDAGSGKVIDEKPVPQYALAFDGVDDYVELPTLKFDRAEAFTMEIWADVENSQESPRLLNYAGVSGRLAKIQFATSAIHAGLAVGDPMKPERNGPYSLLTFENQYLAGPVHVALCWAPDDKSPDGKLSVYWNGRPCTTQLLHYGDMLWPDGGSSVIGAHLRIAQQPHHFLKGRVRQVRFSRGIRYPNEFSPQESWSPDANTLALYRFEEGAGDKLIDSSGNNHHGRIIGAKWVRSDEIASQPASYALEFNGTSDYAEIPIKLGQLGKFQPGKPFTYEAFVTVHEQRPEARVAITRTPQMTPGIMGHLQVGGISYSHGQPLSAGPFGTRVFTDAPQPQGQEVHLALVWDGTEVRFYADGVLQRKGTKTVPVENASNTAQFDRAWFSLCGMWSKEGSTNHFAGRIRELRISTVARYSGNFTPQPRHSPDADTLGLYHFDEGQGNVLTDSSGNGHNGKITGGKWVTVDAAAAVPAPSASPPQAAAPDNSTLANSAPVAPRIALAFDHESTVKPRLLKVDISRPFTLECWVTPTSDRSKEGCAVVMVSPLTGLRWQGSRGWVFGIDTPVAPHNRVTPRTEETTVRLNQRVHLAGVRTERELILFIDGKVASRTPLESVAPPASSTFLIGGSGIHGFVGQFDELRVSQTARYTKEFTPQERLETDENTLAAYHFDEGQGDQLTDSSGNGYHGPIVGAKWVTSNDPPTPKLGWHNWPADAPPPAIAPFDAIQAKAHQDAWANYLGVPVEHTNSIGMKFRLVPPGKFLMGSPPTEQGRESYGKGSEKQHEVEITRPFYLGLFEVTQEEYEKLKGKNPSFQSAQGGGDRDRVKGLDTRRFPVESVSWNDAKDLCQKLGELPAEQGLHYRLPTEAEWEYAFRAGTTTVFYVGDTLTSHQGNFIYKFPYGTTEQGPDAGHYTVAGSYAPNPFGFYDMIGNVCEWCEDAYVTDHSIGSPQDPWNKEGGRRVRRGGPATAMGVYQRAAVRFPEVPTRIMPDLGFRLVLEIDEVASKQIGAPPNEITEPRP